MNWLKIDQKYLGTCAPKKCASEQFPALLLTKLRSDHLNLRWSVPDTALCDVDLRRPWAEGSKKPAEKIKLFIFSIRQIKIGRKIEPKITNEPEQPFYPLKIVNCNW